MVVEGSRAVAWLANCWRDLADALRVRVVRRGLYGTLLIAIGALSPAYLPRSSPWWTWLSARRAEGLPSKLIGTAATMAGLLLIMSAWYRLRPGARGGAPGDATGPAAYLTLKHWAVLAWWSLPFLAAPPIFSLYGTLLIAIGALSPAYLP
ncbi:MAG: hypothetical protein L0L50_06005, partial [Propionibacterium sp.]|nr:hypothetical protein [Propionibacterium sp.]